MDIVRMRGAGTVIHVCSGTRDTCPVLAIHVSLLVRHVTDIHGLDVQISRPVLATAAAGRVGDGGAAGARRHGHVARRARVGGPGGRAVRRVRQRVFQSAATRHNIYIDIECRSVGFSRIVISELSFVLFDAVLCCNTLFVLNGGTIISTTHHKIQFNLKN